MAHGQSKQPTQPPKALRIERSGLHRLRLHVREYLAMAGFGVLLCFFVPAAYVWMVLLASAGLIAVLVTKDLMLRDTVFSASKQGLGFQQVRPDLQNERWISAPWDEVVGYAFVPDGRGPSLVTLQEPQGEQAYELPFAEMRPEDVQAAISVLKWYDQN